MEREDLKLSIEGNASRWLRAAGDRGACASGRG
jgi:hypothetical protein